MSNTAVYTTMCSGGALYEKDDITWATRWHRSTRDYRGLSLCASRDGLAVSLAVAEEDSDPGQGTGTARIVIATARTGA